MRAAARMPLLQRLMDSGQQGLIFQHSIGLPHPLLPQLVYGFMNKAIAKVALGMAEINHGRTSLRGGNAWVRAVTAADSLRRSAPWDSRRRAPTRGALGRDHIWGSLGGDE